MAYNLTTIVHDKQPCDYNQSVPKEVFPSFIVLRIALHDLLILSTQDFHKFSNSTLEFGTVNFFVGIL